MLAKDLRMLLDWCRQINIFLNFCVEAPCLGFLICWLVMLSWHGLTLQYDDILYASFFLSLCVSLLCVCVFYLLLPFPFLENIPSLIRGSTDFRRTMTCGDYYARQTTRRVTPVQTSQPVRPRDEPVISMIAYFLELIWVKTRATGPWGPVQFETQGQRRLIVEFSSYFVRTSIKISTT